eukprot:g26254.t1
MMTARQPTIPYACVSSMALAKEALELCNKRRVQPFSKQMFAGASAFAELLAGYVRDYPLRFAYYANWLTDTFVECLDAGTGPYQVPGGGEQLCSMLEWNAGVAEKNLAKYLRDLMAAKHPKSLLNTFNLVLDFGYNSYESMCKSMQKGWPRTVYDPMGGHVSVEELYQQNQDGRPYWGVSGGGGAGAGFEIFCVNDTNEEEETIITGGGGGGGGVNTPEEGTPIEAGGGGGGGVQVGADGIPAVGAGAGNHPPGVISIEMTQTDHKNWIESMKKVAESIRSCASTPGKHISLRGGDGGGAGFEAYLPWNVTNPEGNPEEVQPHGLSFGYGFQFARHSCLALALRTTHVTIAWILHRFTRCECLKSQPASGSFIYTPTGVTGTSIGSAVLGGALVPSEYSNLPRLDGRAVVEFTLVRGPEAGTKVYSVDSDLYNEAKFKLTVDGYAAPLSAGNFVDLVQRGFYTGMDIQRADGFIIQTGDPGPEKGGGFQPTPGGPVRQIPLEVGIRGRPEASTEPTARSAKRVADGTAALARREFDNDSASSQDCDWRVAYVPAQDHPEGSERIIYDAVWSQYPRLVDPSRSKSYQPAMGITSTAVLGRIPQAHKTMGAPELARFYEILEFHWTEADMDAAADHDDDGNDGDEFFPSENDGYGPAGEEGPEEYKVPEGTAETELDEDTMDGDSDVVVVQELRKAETPDNQLGLSPEETSLFGSPPAESDPPALPGIDVPCETPPTKRSKIGEQDAKSNASEKTAMPPPPQISIPLPPMPHPSLPREVQALIIQARIAALKLSSCMEFFVVWGCRDFPYIVICSLCLVHLRFQMEHAGQHDGKDQEPASTSAVGLPASTLSRAKSSAHVEVPMDNAETQPLEESWPEIPIVLDDTQDTQIYVPSPDAGKKLERAKMLSFNSQEGVSELAAPGQTAEVAACDGDAPEGAKKIPEENTLPQQKEVAEAARIHEGKSAEVAPPQEKTGKTTQVAPPQEKGEKTTQVATPQEKAEKTTEVAPPQEKTEKTTEVAPPEDKAAHEPGLGDKLDQEPGSAAAAPKKKQKQEPDSEVAALLGQKVKHTYALWEASYGLMNEHGVGMGESTCSAFLVGTGLSQGGTALFSIGNLMAIALERCKTARCAIQTMGDLGAFYGFYGEDPGMGGAGEAVTLVDQSGEAWVFHICGGVPSSEKNASWATQRGALWAAQRVPSGHVAVVANSMIIRQIDFEDKENFMLHPGLKDLLQDLRRQQADRKEAKLWNGRGQLDWQKAVSPNMETFSYFPGLAPIPMYSTLRMWGVYRQAAPSAKIRATKDLLPSAQQSTGRDRPLGEALAHVDLQNPPPHAIWDGQLLRLVFGRLQRLALRGNDWILPDDQGYADFSQTFARASPHLANLLQLSLTWDSPMTDEEEPSELDHPHPFLQFFLMADLRRLRSLSLQGCSYSNFFLQSLVGFINRHRNSLEELQIRLTKRDEMRTVPELLAGLWVLPHVKSLLFPLDEQHFRSEFRHLSFQRLPRVFPALRFLALLFCDLWEAGSDGSENAVQRIRSRYTEVYQMNSSLQRIIEFCDIYNDVLPFEGYTEEICSDWGSSFTPVEQAIDANVIEQYVYPKVQRLQREVYHETQEAIDHAESSLDLAERASQIQRKVTEEWWRLAEQMVVRYNDHFYNFPESDPTNVGSIGYPAFWLEMIGYDQEFYRPHWFQRSPWVPKMLPDAIKDDPPAVAPSSHLADDLLGRLPPRPASCSARHLLPVERDMTPAGKNLFDGRYGSFGYVTEGAAFLRKIKQGDIIKELKDFVKKEHPKQRYVPPVSLPEHAKHKYLLHLDGTAASNRFLKLLLMGSVVLKQDSVYEEPVTANLTATLQWLRTHDADARAIARAGQRVAREELGRRGAMCYWQKMLASNFLGGSPRLRPRHRRSSKMSVEVDGPRFKEIEIMAAEMETRLRDSVLRVLRPTLAQVSELEGKQKDVGLARSSSSWQTWRRRGVLTMFKHDELHPNSSWLALGFLGGFGFRVRGAGWKLSWRGGSTCVLFHGKGMILFRADL